ncbi:glutathione hydrolase 5 proenzyme [Rhinophrynus dorsalis]
MPREKDPETAAVCSRADRKEAQRRQERWCQKRSKMGAKEGQNSSQRRGKDNQSDEQKRRQSASQKQVAKDRSGGKTPVDASETGVGALLSQRSGPVLLRQQEKDCDGGFLHGAVAADSGICSDIGRDILKQGGSAVDGAIAALLCTSVIHPQSMGLGGGVIFTIYNASTGQVEVINAREKVPSRAGLDFALYCRESSSFMKPGVQWIGIPGELRGYEVAHQRHGRLPWKSLFEPTIRLVTNGVRVSPVTSKYMENPMIKPLIKNKSVCKLLCKDQDVLKEGQVINFTQLGHTLSTVAEKGADGFYLGPIAEQMVEDLRAQGSNMTLDDFRNYKVQIVKPLNVSLGNYNLYSAPPPSGGALLSFILNILEGYHFSVSSMQNEKVQTETYHRIAEALKFANAQKKKLRDPLTNKDIEEFTASLLSESFTEEIRRWIDDYGNHSLSYYNVTVPHPETYGTSHISIISPDGSSVSVTSSINHIFGSMVYSPRTGIIFNNQMADFCTGDNQRSISKGERPPSSMAPSILLSKDKKTQLVIGASGGSFIPSATAQAIMNKLWFGTNLTDAILYPILHVTSENLVTFESTFSKAVQKGLQKRGHNLSNSSLFFNVVQGVSQEGTCLFAYSDKRKMGRAAGY